MKKLIITVFALIATLQFATAENKKVYGVNYFPGMEKFPTIRSVEHKKDLQPDFKPENLLLDHNKISKLHLRLITKEDPEGKRLQWNMSLPLRHVFLSRFASMEKLGANVKDEDVWGRGYDHLEITFERTDGSVLPPYRLFRNTITVNNVDFYDTSKGIETWVFSTVNNYKQLLIVDKALNVDDFKRCKALGNLSHETDPRQCILPDGTTFLEVNTEMKPDTIRTFNFDDCFANKNPLIAGFPRRCIAPGGRIYTETPRVQ
ncbi:MAG: hypothetical protein GY793_11360 [Proteobacteria bacterium]|nr:hypothetical protein [Pseudomonadota bacterium]